MSVTPFRRRMNPMYAKIEVMSDEWGTFRVYRNDNPINPHEMLKVSELLQRFALGWIEATREDGA